MNPTSTSASYKFPSAATIGGLPAEDWVGRMVKCWRERGHPGRCTIKSVISNTTLLVRPHPNHGKDEFAEIRHIQPWWSKNPDLKLRAEMHELPIYESADPVDDAPIEETQPTPDPIVNTAEPIRTTAEPVIATLPHIVRPQLTMPVTDITIPEFLSDVKCSWEGSLADLLTTLPATVKVYGEAVSHYREAEAQFEKAKLDLLAAEQMMRDLNCNPVSLVAEASPKPPEIQPHETHAGDPKPQLVDTSGVPDDRTRVQIRGGRLVYGSLEMALRNVLHGMLVGDYAMVADLTGRVGLPLAKRGQVANTLTLIMDSGLNRAFEKITEGVERGYRRFSNAA